MPQPGRAVHLVRQNHAGKARADCRADGAPARHHLAYILLAPQAEREPVPASRDPSDEAVAESPLGEFHARHGGIADGCLTKGGQGGRRAGDGGGGTEIGHAPPSFPPLPPFSPSSLLAVCAPPARSRPSIPP